MRFWGAPLRGSTDLQVGLIVPGTEGVPTARRTCACLDDTVGLHLREIGAKRLNLRHRHVAGREAQRKRMPTGDDTRPEILASGNEHHGSGLCEIALNRHGSSNRSKAGDETASVIHREVKARQQRLRTQTGLLERRTKRGRGGGIEPQEGVDDVMRGGGRRGRRGGRED